MSKELSKLIRRLCIDNNTNPNELAKKIGVSHTAVYRTLNGKQPLSKRLYDGIVKHLKMTDVDKKILRSYVYSFKDQQIAELKAENERLKEENSTKKSISDMVGKIGECNNALEEYNTTRQNKILMFSNQKLLHQLEEKDQEIEYLKEFLSMSSLTKEVTNQVCNKIRAFDTNINKQKTSYTDYVCSLMDILDQIEKGEI